MTIVLINCALNYFIACLSNIITNIFTFFVFILAKKERHIVFLYVINDVLQHSKRKNAQRIYDEILAVLTDVVTYFR